MTVKTSYQPGEPIWVDLSSPDVDASRAFYGALFGWNAPPGLEEFGGYANFELDGRKVAGLMPLMAPDRPPVWSCYVCTDDADKTTALVEQAGGSVIAPPMDVADLGRMAVHADPSGAVFGVWQAGSHVGTGLVDEPGTTAWVELTATDPAGAAPFYRSVFGWDASVSESYVEFTLAGTSVAGCADPSQGTTGWLPYFSVDDPGATAERASELGGTVVLPLTAFPGGSCCILRDPHGAAFGVMHTTP
jgi:hypothetical protein